MDGGTKDEFATLAHSLVDAAISKALNILQNECNEEALAKYAATVTVPKTVSRNTDKVKIEKTPSRRNIVWSSIEEFTVDKGKLEIMEFIKVGLFLFCFSSSVKLTFPLLTVSKKRH